MKFARSVPVAALVIALPSTAMAYIDAGTGSILAQGIIGALAVVAVYFRRLSAAVRGVFRRSTADADKPDQ